LSLELGAIVRGVGRVPSDYNLLGVWGNVDGRDTQGLVIACSFIEVVNAMLEPLLNQKVVIDLASEYVCLGTLVAIHDGFMELKNADLHDLRDTETTRENYVHASASTGIKRNRKHLFLARGQVVAVSLLEDVIGD
jgi:hypothetical protein